MNSPFRMQMTAMQPFRKYYGSLLCLRAVSAFLGTGYIHPDEYFQNGEITAGSILDLHSLKTWEWESAFPCRSIIPPFLTTGVPIVALKALVSDQPISPELIFYAERLSFLLLSLVLDYTIYHIVPFHFRQRALLLLSSSHVLLTFQVRPFSNSIEASLLAGCLACFSSLLSKSSELKVKKVLYLSAIAILFVLGAYTRITFFAFATPIAVEILRWSLRSSTITQAFHWRPWLQLISLPTLLGLSTLLLLIFTDTIYFQGSSGITAAKLVLTPYNFLRYNLSSENLAKHGIHPRWLHIVVNLPMIVSPGLMLYGVLSILQLFKSHGATKREDGDSAQRVVTRVSAYSIVCSLVMLSIQPHQEARFLTPLIVPFIVLVANAGYLQRSSKLFWVSWIIFNSVLTILFGVLHQGGVVRSLWLVHDLALSNDSYSMNAHSAVVYWKTYMPPRHLLAIPTHYVNTEAISVIDLAGLPATSFQNTLLNLPNHDENATIYLVTPPFAIRDLAPQVAQCFQLNARVTPHLDLDHIAESIEMGWRDGLSLGVYVGERACIAGDPK